MSVVIPHLQIQIRQAVETLVQSLDRADRKLDGQLLNGIDSGALCYAALTVVMRMMIWLCAEAHGLSISCDGFSEESDSLASIGRRLREKADHLGREALKNTFDEWRCVLRSFRRVHALAQDEALFDPDDAPFLEGRVSGTVSFQGCDLCVPTVDDEALLGLFDALTVLRLKNGEQKIDYREFEIEYIGHVYEGLLDLEVVRTNDVVLGLDYNPAASQTNPFFTLTELESARRDSSRQLRDRIAARIGKKLSDRYWKLHFDVCDDALMAQLCALCDGDESLVQRIMPFAALLQKDLRNRPVVYLQNTYRVTTGRFRADTGTFYTPGELTALAVREAIDPVIEPIGSVRELLALNICDPAMGAGAFLLQVIRHLAEKMVSLWENEVQSGQTVHEFPEVSDWTHGDRLCFARRLVAENCIYGVDINPMAVELARWSIRLLTWFKGMPLVCLRDRLKCGDSLLGIHGMAPEWHDPEKQAMDEYKRLDDCRQQIVDRLKTAVMDHQKDTAAILADVFVGEAFRWAGSPKKRAKALEGVLDLACDILDKNAPNHISALEKARQMAGDDLALDADKPRKPFHWWIEFPGVMMNGGFDIVVGNPPFGVDMTRREMAYHKDNDDVLEKRFDIYMAFYALGLSLTRNTLSFVTPDKWLSKSFGMRFRQYPMKSCMTKIYHIGNGAFRNALVDIVVSVFNKKNHGSLELYVNRDGRINKVNTVDLSSLNPPYLIDQFFHEPSPIVIQLDKLTHTLADYAWCEYAMVGPTAYQLKPLIHESDDQTAGEFKVITTGLVDKYVHRWHSKPMKYLEQKYRWPSVKSGDIKKTFGDTFLKRVSSPKCVIKGLNLLDCCIDFDGTCMSTVATLNIRSDNPDLLMVLAAILNSSLILKYIRSKYFTGGYCGGTMFTPDMMNRLPVPSLDDLSQWQDVVLAVSAVLNDNSVKNQIRVDDLVCKHYGMNDGGPGQDCRVLRNS